VHPVIQTRSDLHVGNGICSTSSLPGTTPCNRTIRGAAATVIRSLPTGNSTPARRHPRPVSVAPRGTPSIFGEQRNKQTASCGNRRQHLTVLQHPPSCGPSVASQPLWIQLNLRQNSGTRFPYSASERAGFAVKFHPFHRRQRQGSTSCHTGTNDNGSGTSSLRGELDVYGLQPIRRRPFPQDKSFLLSGSIPKYTCNWCAAGRRAAFFVP